MTLNIGKKILLMILISITLTASTMLLLSYFYNKTTSESLAVIKGNGEFLLDFKDVELKLQMYKNSKDTKLIAEARKSLERFRSNLDVRINKLRMEGATQETVIMSSDISAKTGEIQLNISSLSKGYNELALTKILLAVTEVNAKLSTLVSNEQKSFEADVANLKLYMYAGIIVIAIIIIIFSLQISRSVVSPIKKLIEASISTSKGDLTHGIKFSSNDEMGALASSFNNLVLNLSTIVKQLRTTSSLVSKYSGEYATASEELNASAINIQNSVQGIARGAYVQKKQIEKAGQVIENMVTSVQKVAMRAQTQAEKTNSATSIAQKGSDATKATISKMTQINSSVNNSTALVRKLKERSDQIEDIVEAITKIAEQTNLLAINTAIEAARAGEGAREFRVIADEVRKLAEGSGKAAEQIVKLLKEIQIDTSKAISATESGAKEVSEGVEYVVKTGKSLEELAKAVWEVSNLASEISRATQEQNSGVDQVRKAMSAIASVSEENAKSTDDVLNSANGQTSRTKQITEASAELKKLSVELVDVVKQFKV